MKYLYSKIMDSSNDFVEIPFLTPEELGILKAHNISYQKIKNIYRVNALKAKAVFCHVTS